MDGHVPQGARQLLAHFHPRLGATDERRATRSPGTSSKRKGHAPERVFSSKGLVSRLSGWFCRPEGGSKSGNTGRAVTHAFGWAWERQTRDRSDVRLRSHPALASAESVVRWTKNITPEEYLREHADRLRAFARYTSPEASMRLIESAQFLELRADEFRKQSIAKSKLEATQAAVRKIFALPRLRRVR